MTIRHDMGVAHVAQPDAAGAVDLVVRITPLQRILAVGLQSDVRADFQHPHPDHLPRIVARNVVHARDL